MNDSDDTHITPDDTIIQDDESQDDTIVEASDLTLIDQDHTSLSVQEDTGVVLEETQAIIEQTMGAQDTTEAYGTLLNSLIAEEVRTTHAEIPNQETATAQRLHVALSDLRTFALDRPVIVGRMPSAPRTARESVTLVTVDSPNKYVSSSHVRIEQVGTFAVVTDLGSQNGTVIRVPGKPELTLGVGQSSTVEVNSLIEIGDNIRLEILDEIPLS